MNGFRDAAMGDVTSEVRTEEFGYSKEGYSKDGKGVVPRSQVVNKEVFHRWGVWANAEGYFDSVNVASASVGVDYRIKPHWLIGAYAQTWYTRHSVFRGGLYTAFYENGFWGVFGGAAGYNDYSAYGSLGYDFRLGKNSNWIAGPVVAVQYDNDTVDHGLGKGQVLWERAGGRIAYLGRLSPSVQVMYQHEGLDNDSRRADGVWVGCSLSYAITPSWSVYTSYEAEILTREQLQNVLVGTRFSF